MLTSFEQKFLENVLCYSSKLRLMPIEWSKGQVQSGDPSKARHRRVFGILGVGYHVYYILLSLIRMPTQNQTNLILSAFLILASVAAISMILTIWLYTSDLIQLYNNIFKVNRALQLKTGMQPLNERDTKFRSKLFVIVVLSTAAAPICITIQTLVANWVTFESTLSLGIFVIFTLTADALLFNAFPVISAILISSTFTALFWLDKACIEWPAQIQNTDNIQGDLDIETLKWNCIAVYNTVRVMNDLHNCAFGSIFIPVLKLCCVWGLLIAAYCTINLGTSMGPLLFTFFLLYFFAISVIIAPGAMLMSQVYNISDKYSKNFKHAFGVFNNEEARLLTKILRATPCLKCKIGEFYYMESKAKLTLLDNITRGIAFMLVSFK